MNTASVCVCVFAGVLGIVAYRKTLCVCVCACANEGEHCGLSQPVICTLLSNELTVQKKGENEQSAADP